MQTGAYAFGTRGGGAKQPGQGSWGTAPVQQERVGRVRQRGRAVALGSSAGRTGRPTFVGSVAHPLACPDGMCDGACLQASRGNMEQGDIYNMVFLDNNGLALEAAWSKREA